MRDVRGAASGKEGSISRGFRAAVCSVLAFPSGLHPPAKASRVFFLVCTPLSSRHCPSPSHHVKWEPVCIWMKCIK